MAIVKANPIRDIDRDSVHILPLACLPLETAGLKRTRMVKNSRLESAIEMFDDDKSGSGQISLNSLHKIFSKIEGNDIQILEKLSELYSYDVFCLRIQLRNLGIQVDDEDNLRLSKAKQNELSEYMKQFTQRFILEIYGNDDDQVKSYNDVMGLFQNPDVALAMSKLKMMANRLGIEIDGVPAFLEDYGDIYLSVAYYRQCMDMVQPSIQDFEYSVKEIISHPQLKQDFELVALCDRLLNKVHRLNTVASERFAVFSQSTDEMWEDINAESFLDFKTLVEANHTAIGGILCKLLVKMGSWSEKFSMRNTSSPVKRAEFIRTEMRQGL